MVAALADEAQSDVHVGCRVMNSAKLNEKLATAKLKKSNHPSFEQIAGPYGQMDSEFWTLHNFVADLGDRL